MEQTKNNNVMAEVDVSTIAKPNGVPYGWVVNPHNNPDIQYVKTSKIPLIRENWISPQALQKLCSKMGCDQTTHDRLPNSHYRDQTQPNIISQSSLLR